MMGETTSSIVFAVIAILSFTTARDITFPPVFRADSHQTSFGNNLDDIDIVSGQQFSGLTTYASVPYLRCFDENVDVQKYDIAFLGAPFDTVSAEKCILDLSKFFWSLHVDKSVPRSYSCNLHGSGASL